MDFKTNIGTISFNIDPSRYVDITFTEYKELLKTQNKHDLHPDEIALLFGYLINAVYSFTQDYFTNDRVKRKFAGVLFEVNSSEELIRVKSGTHVAYLENDAIWQIIHSLYDAFASTLLKVANMQTYLALTNMNSGGNRAADVFIGLPEKELNRIEIEELQNAVGDFMEALGFEYEAKDEPVWGSFFDWLKFKLKDPKTKEEIAELYEDGKNALRFKLNLPSADATGKLAEAASSLIDHLAPFKRAVIRAGQILILKTTVDGEPYLVVETISPKLSLDLDSNPKLLRNPEELLKFIGQEPKKSLDALGEGGEGAPQAI